MTNLKKLHECGLFYCDRRRNRVCCYHCGYKKKCRNACQNAPNVCGQYLVEEEPESCSSERF